MLSTVWLSGPNCLQLSPCFADQDALVPKFWVTNTSAVSEPRTATTTTTSLTGFLDGAAFGAYGSACCRRGCWCAFVIISQRNRKTPTCNSRCLLIMYMPSALDLRSHAFRPSNHLCSTFLLPAPPQFLYQAPPGAQQLTRPDFSNVPHFGQVIVLTIVGVMDGMLIGVLVMSSRSGIGRRDAYRRVFCMVPSVSPDVHTVCDIDP